MAKKAEIACLQTQPAADVKTAVSEAMPLAERAVQSGATLLFLPEYCGGLAVQGAKVVPPVSEESAHPMLRAFSQFSAANNVWVMLGSIAISGPGAKFFNRGYLLDDCGAIHGTYDKIHLFDIRLSRAEVHCESASVAPGARAVVHDTPFGRIGHTICYDLRFPHLYRALAQAGAEIIACPAAFTRATGAAHWHALNRARAIENGCYMVSPGATGPVPGGGDCYGHSLVVSPWGDVVADAGAAPTVLRAQLDLGAVANARRRIPSLYHDRAFTISENSGIGLEA